MISSAMFFDWSPTLSSLRMMDRIQRACAVSSGNRHGAYVACLDCGKEFEYDWHAMRIRDPITPVRIPAQVSLSAGNRQNSASQINYSLSKRRI